MAPNNFPEKKLKPEIHKAREKTIKRKEEHNARKKRIEENLRNASSDEERQKLEQEKKNLEEDTMELDNNEELPGEPEHDQTDKGDVITEEIVSPPVPEIAITDAENGTASLPLDIDENDDHDPETLLTPGAFRKRLGLDHGGYVVAKREIGRRVQLLLEYGPPNASMFRFKGAADVDTTYDEEKIPDITDPENRRGHLRVRKKWTYTSKDVAAIQGVVWIFNEESGKEPLDLLDPDMMAEDKMHNPGTKYPHTYVKIKWTDGEKTWEPRANFVRVWGKSKKAADKAIFMAAEYQEKRYKEYCNNQRPPEDRSPTPNPDILRVKREDSVDGLPEEQRSKKGTKTGTQAPDESSSGEEISEPIPKLHDVTLFRTNWCKVKHKDPENLSDLDEATVLATWELAQQISATLKV
ncbi:MAG: hypothetical protein M1834_008507 [Cirrosporium novae-zelandiae]|nr:MAG: hypothetical protein M1834_008507 [Cirrosporium novae-zelandiae]